MLEKALDGFVRRAITSVDLPWRPDSIVDRHFIFGDESHFIVGKIKSIGYGPREGIVLYVSAPRYRAMDIWRFGRKDDKWIAWGHRSKEEEGETRQESRDGTFVLL